MEKKKFKFNITDIVIILVVILLAVFGWGIISDKGESSVTAVSDVSFTVEITKCDKSFGDAIAIGDDIYDSLQGGYYGKVENVEIMPETTVAPNADSGTFSLETYPDRYSVYVTIKGTPTTMTDGNIMFANQKVKVGTMAYLKSAGYVGFGYVTDVQVQE